MYHVQQKFARTGTGKRVGFRSFRKIGGNDDWVDGPKHLVQRAKIWHQAARKMEGGIIKGTTRATYHRMTSIRVARSLQWSKLLTRAKYE